MKRLLSFLAIIAIIAASNCSRIEENNDPVIGIWKSVSADLEGKQPVTSAKEEWIFNDAYLGRYHYIENNSITVKMDFRWEIEDGLYTLTYPENTRPEDYVTLKESGEEARLEHTDGTPFAVKE
ncbi:MAG: hypothetical protein AAGA86_06535 [Bacteroidota bacterium]